MKFLLVIIIFVSVGFLLTSCAVLFGFMRGAPSPVEVTNDVEWAHLANRLLELKRDVFLVQFDDNKLYALRLPGRSGSVPTSIEEYLEDPDNWQNTDSNAKRGYGPSQGYYKMDVITVVPRGTKIHVYKIVKKQTLYDNFTDVFAHVMLEGYEGLPVKISYILKLNFGEVTIPYPTEPERTAMGSEVLYTVSPGVIEYCNESNSDLIRNYE